MQKFKRTEYFKHREKAGRETLKAAVGSLKKGCYVPDLESSASLHSPGIENQNLL